MSAVSCRKLVLRQIIDTLSVLLRRGGFFDQASDRFRV